MTGDIGPDNYAETEPPQHYGEWHCNAKLTDDNVREIRRRVANGESMYRLAKVMGVRKQTVWCIIHGKTWTHLK